MNKAAIFSIVVSVISIVMSLLTIGYNMGMHH